MGKPTGFLEYERQENEAIQPLSRITNFNEFHPFLDGNKRTSIYLGCHFAKINGLDCPMKS